jgi:hypothetical protein
MTSSTRLTLRALAALLPLAACARARTAPTGADPGPNEGTVADASAAFSCAVDAVGQMGYTVTQEVLERARAGNNVGGGSFRAERVTPAARDEATVDELYVAVRVRRASRRGGESAATLRADAARWRERGVRQAEAILTPRARPTATPATRITGRRRTGTDRQRLPGTQASPEAVALVQRCGGG